MYNSSNFVHSCQIFGISELQTHIDDDDDDDSY
jgi:hypothetical protein